jgi:alanine dehydrogenase
MIVGCPSEIKVRENNAGVGSGISNDEYRQVGAEIVETAAEIWASSDMIVKVKEPVQPEYALIKDGQTIYTFLHLAAEPELTQVLLKKRVSGVAYETIQVGNTLPLLKPSSEVAGRMAIQVGAYCLEKPQGGKGILLGGVPGVPRGKVAIIGGGVVGMNAAKMAVGIGADVTVIDHNLERLEYIDDVFLGRLQTLYSTPHNIAQAVIAADLVVGAVLVAGAKAPKLVLREQVKQMSPGSVIVDVAVDQGGCVETMHATTHDNPTFMVDGVVHYGVANMPGAVARTSTFALAHATLPYMRILANLGVVQGCQKSAPLKLGLNTFKGHVTYEAVAQAHGLPFVALEALL